MSSFVALITETDGPRKWEHLKSKDSNSALKESEEMAKVLGDKLYSIEAVEIAQRYLTKIYFY